MKVKAAEKPVKIGLFVDHGCNGSGVLAWAAILSSSPQIDFTMLDRRGMTKDNLAKLEVLVMPGGYTPHQYDNMGETAAVFS